MMDMLWALFEWRMLEDPDTDPNELWNALATEYLKISPQPRHSWWAVRGQLVSSPGYMMNYAAGAFMAADLRQKLAREVERNPGRTWYELASESLFQYGLGARPADVLQSYLGRPVSRMHC